MSQIKPRRGFLRDASCIAAGTGIATFSSDSLAESALDGATDRVQPLDLGMRPAIGCFGAVIFPLRERLYVTFAATGEKGEGTALVELGECVARRYSGGDSDTLSANRIDTDGLAPCGTFEVMNSSWSNSKSLLRTEKTRSKADPLRHFVFTFVGLHPGIDNCGRNFECLSRNIHAELLPAGPFSEVVDYIKLLGGKN